MSPSPIPDHNVAGMRLAMRIEPQLPDEYEAILDVDVDLELAAAGEPGARRAG
ncbi:MAG: hypothetical protein ACRDQB_14970 [Thermocrispum sp.]